MTKHQKIQKYFNQKSKLTIKNPKYLRQLKTLTDFMLREDLDSKGDLTTNRLIKQNKKTKAQIIAKENGILAGIEETLWFLRRHKVTGIRHKKDGDMIKKDDVFLSLSGGIKDILKTERVALNLLQRLSGIATQTNKLIKKTKNKILICPTRKTQWGLLDKKAVAVGGGGTHRLGLYDWVLVKDNHLSQCPLSSFPFPLSPSFWEIEVNTSKEASEFSKYQPDAIMFDNFKSKQIKKMIPKLNSQIIFEASGGINEFNLAEYAKTGVDVISIGALTHSARALDISLELNATNVR
ncbi:MAG: carboxylating nicotinate-nucleotide diphosphorylase [Patescibacteria group bacterium]